MSDSDDSIARVFIGSLINGVALGLLLSFVGQIYFSSSGFMIGAVVGFLLSWGVFFIFSGASRGGKPQPK